MISKKVLVKCTPSMRIASVKLKNFRCFEDLELTLDKCHVLIGENASGKTAVLDAISLITSSIGVANRINEQDFNNLDKGDIEVEIYFDEPFLAKVPDGYVTQDIPCNGMRLEAHRREKAAPGRALSRPFVVEHYTLPILYAEGDVPDMNIDYSKHNVASLVEKTSKGYQSKRKNGSFFPFTYRLLSINNDLINAPQVFYLGIDREKEVSTAGFSSSLRKIVQDLNWRYRKNWDQGKVVSKWENFYSEVISTVEEGKNSRIINPVISRLEKITGLNFADLELSLLSLEAPFSKSFLAKRNTTNQIAHYRLGSGIAILIAYFLIETVSKLDNKDEQLLFLIDEPELHLHPQLQQKLQSEFRESTSQIIYSTQSENLVDISKWQSITRFLSNFKTAPTDDVLQEKMEDKLVSQHLDEIEKFHQHKSIFFKEDNQIFFARKCLFVEGPAEKYGLPVLAGKLKKDLGDITVISCNGKTKIPYYQLLCKAFEIPFYTILDLDGKTISENENSRPVNWADTAALSTISTSFEELFGLGRDAENKTSKLLIKIDTIAPEDIPKEIVDIIDAVSGWSTSS